MSVCPPFLHILDFHFFFRTGRYVRHWTASLASLSLIVISPSLARLSSTEFWSKFIQTLAPLPRLWLSWTLSSLVSRFDKTLKRQISWLYLCSLTELHSSVFHFLPTQDIFERIAKEASFLCKANKKSTITAREIQTACKLSTFSQRLQDEANSRNDFSDDPSFSRSPVLHSNFLQLVWFFQENFQSMPSLKELNQPPSSLRINEKRQVGNRSLRSQLKSTDGNECIDSVDFYRETPLHCFPVPSNQRIASCTS